MSRRSLVLVVAVIVLGAFPAIATASPTEPTLSVGVLHACAISTGAAASCWGDDESGKATAPADLGPVRQVSAGRYQSCAIKADGTVACWGYDWGAPPPTDLGPVRQISVGNLSTCAITADSTVRCWGVADDEQLSVPAGLGTVVQIATTADSNSACAIRTNGTPVCWGGGLGGAGQTPIPGGIGPVTSISVGPSTVCAVKADGTPVCWGAGVSLDTTVPDGIGTVSQLAVSGNFACAVETDGTPACWGADGTEARTTIPVGVGEVTEIAVGRSSACATERSGAVTCWGDPASSVLAVPAGLDVTRPAVDNGRQHACAITAEADVRCWGDATGGRTSVPAMGPVAQLSVGALSTCAVSTGSLVSCWGQNDAGQTAVPTDLGPVRQVSVGRYLACAIKADSTLGCWGYDWGAPPPADLGTVRRVSVGNLTVCAIKTDGTPVCWGTGVDEEATVPGGIGPVQQIVTAAGGTHTCAITAGGAAACWGRDQFDQATVPALLPPALQIEANDATSCATSVGGAPACWGVGINVGTSIPAGTGLVRRMSVGGGDVCADQAAGTITCWGDDTYGQLGGPPTFTSDPAPATGSTGEPYSHTFVAHDPAGLPATLSVASGALPPGVTLDGATGELSGTPTTPGTYSGTISADDGLFAPATQSFSIDVGTGPEAPPTLTVDGSVTTVKSGETISLSGTAEEGADLEIQDNGIPFTNPVVGADGTWTADLVVTDGLHDLQAVVGVLSTSDVVSVAGVSAPYVDTPVADDAVDHSVYVAGDALPGSTIDVRDENGNAIGTTVADPCGCFQLDTDDLDYGPHTLHLTQTYDGVTSDETTMAVRVQPLTPYVTNPQDMSTVGAGIVHFTGYADNGAEVTITTPLGVAITSGAADEDSGYYDLPVTLDPGPYSYVIAQTVDGHTSDPSSSISFTAEVPEPSIDPGAGDGMSGDVVTLSGSGYGGAHLSIRNNAAEVVTATVDPDGRWTADVTLGDGDNVFDVVQDAGTGTPSPSQTIVGHTGPVVEVPDDGATVRSTFAISGYGYQDADVTITDEDDTVIGTATPESCGCWSTTTTVPLSDGPHTLTLHQTHGGTPRTSTFHVVVDPNALGLTSPTGVDPVLGDGLHFTGFGAPGAAITIYDEDSGDELGNGTADSGGAFDIAIDLSPGIHYVAVTQTPDGGVESDPIFLSLLVVMAPPTVGIDGATTAAVGDNVTVSGTAAPGAYVAIFDNGNPSTAAVADDTTGAWSALVPVVAGDNAITAYQVSADFQSYSDFSAPVHATGVGAPAVDAPAEGDAVHQTFDADGTALPGAAVTAFDGNAAPIGTTTADATTGAWSMTTTADLDVGPETLYFHQTLDGVSGPDTTVGVSVLSSGIPSRAPTFGTPFVAGPTPAGGRVEALAIADLDADGRPDIVGADQATSQVTVLHHEAAGGYTSSVAGDTGSAPNAVAVGDVNGDGRPDIVTADLGGSVTVLTKKSGTGYTASTVPLPDQQAYGLAVADLDGDGDLDIAVAIWGDDAVRVLTNDGHGAFTVSTAGPTGGAPLSVAVGDVNGDGRPDLVTANDESTSLTVLTKNAGAGYTSTDVQGVGGGAMTIALADMDGDGDLDAVTDEDGGSVQLWSGDGAGGFTAKLVGQTDFGRTTVRVGDLNGDGQPDIVAANFQTGVVTALTKNVNAGYTASVAGTTDDPAALALGDLDGDGLPDVATANSVENTVTVIPNTTDLVAPVTTDDVPNGWVDGPVTVTLTATDDGGTGVASITYLAGASPADPSDPANSPLTYDPANKPVLNDGESIRYFATDNTGNAEAVKTSAVAKVDLVTPSTTDDVDSSFVSSPVTVTLTATDGGGSGTLVTTYRIVSAGGTAGPPETYDAGAKPALNDGEKIRYSTVDGAGNAETPHDSVAAQVDLFAPVTTDDVPAGYVNAPATVTLTATDDGGSGDLVTTYRIVSAGGTAGSLQTYDESAKPVLNDGELLRYSTADGVGNAEATHDSPVAKVDTAAPVTTDDVPGGYRNAPVSVTLNATDAGGSGSLVTTYRIVSVGGTAGSLQTYDPASKPALNDGENIRYSTVDGAGNAEVAHDSAAAKVDMITPVTTDDVPASFGGAPVTVTLTAIDAGGSAGLVTTYRIVSAGGTAGSLQTYDAGSKPTLGDGEKIRYSTTDGAGNAEVAHDSAAAKVDTAAPVTTDDVPASFRDAPVPVTLTATDAGGSGDLVTTYRIVSAGGTAGSLQTYDAAAKPVLNDGEKLRYSTTDGAGNAEAPHDSAAAKVDQAAPVTSDDVPDEYRNAPVSVTLTATDGGGSGSLVTTYRIVSAGGTAGSLQTYDPASKPTLDDGEKVRYSTTDGAGNAEVAHDSTAAKVDTATPVTTDDVPAEYRNAPVTVTLTATDTGGSGDLVTTYRIDSAGGTAGAPHTYDPASKPTLNDGEKLRYSTTDGAGNAEVAHDSTAAKVDAATPVTTDDVPTTYRNGPIAVTLTATDAGGSGDLVTTYRIVSADGTAGTLQTYDASAKPTLNDGEKLRYSTTDGAGNAETAHDSPAAKVDQTAPVTTDDVPTTYRDTPISVTLTATDAGGSGGLVTTYRIVSASGTAGSPQTYDPADKPTLNDGEKIRYSTTDGAGNTEVAHDSAAAKVDQAAPVTADDVPATYRRAPIPVTLTATDADQSGVATIKYLKGTSPADPSIPGNNALTYDGAAKPTLAGGERIRYYAIDGVGNAETPKTSAAAKVDTATPVTTDDVPSTYRNAAIPVTLTATDTGGSADLVTSYRIVSAGGSPGALQTYDPSAKPTLNDGEKLRYSTADGAGNAEAPHDSAAAQVDRTAPVTTIVDRPAGLTSDARPQVSFTSAAASDTFACALDGAGFTPCTSPYRPVTPLADGEHTIRVRAVNRAGDPDPTPETVTFAVDTEAPVVPAVEAGPPAQSSETTQTIVFAGEPGATFLCALDGGPLEPCSSPYTARALSFGTHRLEIAQVDAAGNTGPVQDVPFEIVKQTPPPSVEPTKARILTAAGGQVTFLAGHTAIGCAVDRGALRACTARLVDAKGTKLAGGTATRAGGGPNVAVTLARTPAGLRASRRRPQGFAGTLRVTVTTLSGRTLTTSRKVVFIASDRVLVSTGRSATLSSSARKQLTTVAKGFRSATKVTCTAFTSNQGSEAAARRLTQSQARAACALIGRYAKKARRVPVGAGSVQPRATNRTAAGRKLNQRIIITITN